MLYTLENHQADFHGTRHFIAPNATIIGSVILAEDASVWFGAILRGDNEPITIGRGSNIQDACVLHTDPGAPLTVGAHCTVGHMVMLHGCSIGEQSLIGIGSVILNHAVIGRHSIVGAKTLIPEGKVFPEGSLILGSPGKVVRSLRVEEIAAIEGAARNYVANAQRYLQELKLDARTPG
ncbi:MAG: gamma carbonic anhydrase family protein [Betaproteobacteria bacterium]|nr:gamma carbonic anhydrase family protein [Betaproteobacteria bacterium]